MSCVSALLLTQAGARVEVVLRARVMCPGVFDLNQVEVQFVGSTQVYRPPGQCITIVEDIPRGDVY